MKQKDWLPVPHLAAANLAGQQQVWIGEQEEKKPQEVEEQEEEEE